MDINQPIEEGKNIVIKRQYTENYPAISVGKSARVRNKIIEAIADGKITQEEFNNILKEYSNDSKKWMKRNSKFFNVSEEGISLSKFGKKILSNIMINENLNEFGPMKGSGNRNYKSNELVDIIGDLDDILMNDRRTERKWDEISQNYLDGEEGYSYWSDLSDWELERAIQDAKYLMKKYKIHINENEINETKFIAFWNGKQHEIEADDLWSAKQAAIKQLRIPKSKQGLLAVKSAEYMNNKEFMYEAMVDVDAIDPNSKGLQKLLKKNNVKMEILTMDGPNGNPEIRLTGKRKDLESVLADSEYGWDNPDLADFIEEGNAFGAARAKAIAAGEDTFEVDGETYPVEDVDAEDEKNAKEFAKESFIIESFSEFVSNDIKKSELRQIIREKINNETFIIPNKNTMEFEEFLREFNLLQNIIDTNQRDFYTDYTFDSLTDEEIDWIEDEIEKYN